MKILVVHSSFSGNTRLIAETIANEVNGDILELKVAKAPPKNKVGKILWAGKTFFTTKFPKLEKFDISIEGYDLIFVGTPVWALTYAPPFNSFFRDIKIQNKQVALFCTHGGLKGKVFNKMKSELSDNKIVGCIDFIQPFDKFKEKYTKAAIVWSRQIAGN
jgi:flavodoxin